LEGSRGGFGTICRGFVGSSPCWPTGRWGGEPCSGTISPGLGRAVDFTDARGMLLSVTPCLPVDVDCLCGQVRGASCCDLWTAQANASHPQTPFRRTRAMRRPVSADHFSDTDKDTSRPSFPHLGRTSPSLTCSFGRRGNRPSPSCRSLASYNGVPVTCRGFGSYGCCWTIFPIATLDHRCRTWRDGREAGGHRFVATGPPRDPRNPVMHVLSHRGKGRMPHTPARETR
jgi:hypothetical protein